MRIIIQRTSIRDSAMPLLRRAWSINKRFVMRLMRLAGAGALLCTMAVFSAAPAHVVLEKREAAVGTYYKAVFQVSHGCEGSPTVKLRIRIPDGVIAVKPMPKPGWTIETVKDAYAATAAHHGHEVSEGVREVIWGGKLADDYYDEFVLTGFLADVLKSGTTLYFPATQECEQGINRWVEIAQPGRPAPKAPAPALKLIAKP